MSMRREQFRREESVLVEWIDADLCLYLPQTHDVAVLNRTAAEIWELLETYVNPAEIAVRLGDRYAVPADSLRADVDRVIDDLTHRGFLHTA